MKSKDYFFKKKNIFKSDGASLNETLGIVAICFFVLFSFSGTAYALNWNDREWREAGCPESAIGLWNTDGSNNNDKTMRIEKHKVSIIADNNIEGEFVYRKKPLKDRGKFIELFVKPVDHEKQVYIKIRPHMISQIMGAGDGTQSSYNCLIKVFQYSSQKNAKVNKYLSWDIYQFNNTN